MQETFYVHPTAEVEPGAQIGAGTRIWRQAHVRAQASIGESCNIGKGVYVESRVHIGSYVKIQNQVSLFDGVTIEDGVFIGPHVCFTNDMFPRAITPDGCLKSVDDWVITPTLVRYGASIGAGYERCSSSCAGFWQPGSCARLCVPMCTSSVSHTRTG